MSYFNTYSPFIVQQSNSLGIPSAIGLGLFQQESGFDPNAIGDNGAAIGIGQLHLGAASDMGVTDRNDPYQSITGALGYLKRQYNKYGNWTDALSAYNQGHASSAGLGYAASVLNKAKKFLTGGVSVDTLAKGGACAASGGTDIMSCLSAGSSLLGFGGGGGDQCGSLDFVCKLREWITSSSFFTRLALATLALLLILGGLYLMKGKE